MARDREYDRLQSELEEAFSEFLRGPRLRHAKGFRPSVDVFRTADGPSVVVTADLAGIDPSELELSFVDGVLAIKGVRRNPAASEPQYHQMEIDYGPFERRIPIGTDVDLEAAQASYHRGVLTVTLPIAQQPVPPVRFLITIRA